MNNYFKEITPEMIKTVDRLKSTDFENATKDEIELYAQWSKINALQDEEFKRSAETRDNEAKARREEYKRQADAAVETLNTLNELAHARLKAVENGQI